MPEQKPVGSTLSKEKQQASDAVVATVFFDGACPLCSREIRHYRSLRGADHLVWIDISTDDRMLAVHGLERQEAMERFHVLDASGAWQIGARGFIELWSHLPAYRWLASVLRLMHMENTLDFVYTQFARWRLQRRCNSASCQR
jgi:predicted DCC family thiol-disulfide oxidoreductase YuxK